MIEPNHFFLLFVEGRIKRSEGVDVQWLVDKMQQHGVSQGMNLDGGKTACMVFMGKKLEINNPEGLVKQSRTVSNMIGAGFSTLVPDYSGIEK